MDHLLHIQEEGETPLELYGTLSAEELAVLFRNESRHVDWCWKRPMKLFMPLHEFVGFLGSNIPGSGAEEFFETNFRHALSEEGAAYLRTHLAVCALKNMARLYFSFRNPNVPESTWNEGGVDFGDMELITTVLDKFQVWNEALGPRFNPLDHPKKFKPICNPNNHTWICRAYFNFRNRVALLEKYVDRRFDLLRKFEHDAMSRYQAEHVFRESDDTVQVDTTLRELESIKVIPNELPPPLYRRDVPIDLPDLPPPQAYSGFIPVYPESVVRQGDSLPRQFLFAGLVIAVAVVYARFVS